MEELMLGPDRRGLQSGFCYQPFGGLWPRCHFSEPQLPDSCKAETTPPLSQGYQQGVNEIMNAKYLSTGSK